MERTFHDLMINATERTPEKVAALHQNDSITYRQVFDDSMLLAHALVGFGLKNGGRVCFYLEKRFEKIISMFGISIAGGIMVPIRKLSHAKQVSYILNNCEANVLITTPSRIDVLLANFKELPLLKTIISIGKVDERCALKGIDIIEWDDIMKEPLTSSRTPCVMQRDLAAILYTSGSTGMPKGVVLSHQNIVIGAKSVDEYLKINKDDRLLSILTFSFDYGLNQLTTVFLKNAQIVLLEYLFPKDILKAVERYKITGLAAVATTWIQLLQIPWENNLDSLRYVTNSGASIPVKLVKRLRQRIPKADVYLMYGLTEAFRSTYLEPSKVDSHPSSIGKAIPGEQILVLDKNNQQVKPGGRGELVHRGVLVAQGYWGEPELTAERFRKNPLQLPDAPIEETVVYSGDFVKIDAEGYLYFEGRKDEMIKSAGNRISPTEIEEILYNSGFISDVVAMGIPHDIYGQVVRVVLSLHPHEKKSEKDVLLYCRNNMPSYMIPHEIKIWDKLPRNTNDKLDRAKIRDDLNHSTEQGGI